MPSPIRFLDAYYSIVYSNWLLCIPTGSAVHLWHRNWIVYARIPLLGIRNCSVAYTETSSHLLCNLCNKLLLLLCQFSNKDAKPTIQDLQG